MPATALASASAAVRRTQEGLSAATAGGPRGRGADRDVHAEAGLTAPSSRRTWSGASHGVIAA